MTKLDKRFEFRVTADLHSRIVAAQRAEAVRSTERVPNISETARMLLERGLRYQSALSAVRLLVDGKGDEARRLHPEVFADAAKD